MSLPHIILGLLQRRSMTGYDLKNGCFDKEIAHLWAADQAQIYRTLDKLVEQEWVVYEIEIQHDRPNRKVYSLTAAGAEELLRWLQQSQPLPNLREPLLVQLFFTQQSQLTAEMMIRLLAQQLTAHQEKLTCYQTIDRQEQADSIDNQIVRAASPMENRRSSLHHLAIEFLIKREEMYVDWLKMAIETLDL
jgi:PadR family transcriptional regulator, regulatory protein AphA